MKRLFPALFLVLVSCEVFGQYGQEWIEFGRPWFKIPVARAGLYRLTFAELQQAGVRVSTDPRTFRLFHHGIEQAIRVHGEDDGVFDTADYIEFYGRGNDGTLDSTLYETSSYQPHRYYNLFSDTTAYFLTYGMGTGKRMAVESGSSSGLVPIGWHWDEKLLVLKSSYSSGVDYGNVQKTVFDRGEGWMGNVILHGQETAYTIGGITGGLPANGKPRVELLVTGRGEMPHQVEVYAGGRMLTTLSFSSYDSYKYVSEIDWPDIDANGQLVLKLRVTGAAGPDRVSVGYILLRYPQAVSTQGAAEKVFRIPPHSTGSSLMRLNDAPTGTQLFDITTPDATASVNSVGTTTLDAVLPSSNRERMVFATSTVLTPAWIKRVAFREFTPGQADYVIITHPSLRRPARGYIDPVKAYAEYRSLAEGGGFDTLVVNVGQLYDQFNYGEASPRAIFQFMKFLAAGKLPRYLFLIGKGLDVNYGYRRNPGAFTEFRDLVPPAGYPASDMAFTAGLAGIAGVPAVATGRLSATGAAEVAAYLDKVKERDALPFNDLRRKTVLHLSGGIEESEPATFRAILGSLEPVAKGVYFGANVIAVSKGATNVHLVNIADEVNTGLGLVTFFGHSAPSTLDFDIGLVSDPVMGYDNRGKYPFLLMNGCNAGSVFLNANIFGENWIKTPEKGAIGFIAHSSYGLLSSLKRYSSLFYAVAFADSAYISKGAGDVQREVARRYLAAYGTTAESVSQVQEMILLGDPAVKVFGAAKPDYAPDGPGVFVSSFGDDAVTASTDSFLLHVPVRNYGIATDRKMRVEVRRQRAAAGSEVVYDTIVPSVLFADTVTLVIRNAGAYGINTFSITVDADNIIDEIDESNNTVAYEYFIPSATTRNLFPYDFGIVTSRDVRLSFQNTDLQSDERKYLLELDTVNTFDSGFRQQYAVTGRVLAVQPVHLPAADSTVYYWRTRIAEPEGSESGEWTVSSFSYIDRGPEGWAQLRFPQFNRNGLQGLVADSEIRRLTYRETVSDVAIRTFSAAAGKPLDSISLKVDGIEFNLLHEGGACRTNTVNLVAFDRRSAQPYAGIYFKWYELLYTYGGRTLLCGREPYSINSFKAEELVTGNHDDLIQYIDNVHEGDSVLLFTMGDAGYSRWPAAARLKLEAIGVGGSELSGLRDGEPVVIFGRKGSPAGTARVYRASGGSTALEVHRTIAGRYTSGNMVSPAIGPARRWDGLVFRTDRGESSDDAAVSILGITPEGHVDTVKVAVTSGENLSFIDPAAYPFLKLVYETSDNVELTPVQLDRWLVLFDPVPEGLVFYRGAQGPVTVREGQPLKADFGFINISNKDFSDSLLVRYSLATGGREAGSPGLKQIAGPLQSDTTLFTVTFNTAEHAGLNDVNVFVNPRTEIERSYDNNIMLLSGYADVLPDVYRPVIEVTIDDRVPANLAYVSASPHITIRLWDENPFLLKTDTTNVTMLLAYPCPDDACDFRPIFFSNPDVEWRPATANTAFQVDIFLNDLTAGTYTLRVSGADVTGNASGADAYEISFRVDDGGIVVADAPHPNPFSFQTYFDVTLTGDKETPAYYTLQLYTLNGLLVREYSDQGGGLHVGRNRLVWDGLDSGGSSLPAGVYVYRLTLTEANLSSRYEGRVMLLK